MCGKEIAVGSLKRLVPTGWRLAETNCIMETPMYIIEQ
jgi:hypothetical protein